MKLSVSGIEKRSSAMITKQVNITNFVSFIGSLTAKK